MAFASDSALTAATTTPKGVTGGSALTRPIAATTAAPASGNTYQITIHASQGMDGKEIALAVRAEIERMEAAKRRRVNSQMSDME